MQMKIEESKYYRMPLIMGPLFDRKDPKFDYPAVEVVAYQYLTDPDAAQELLPECYRVANLPVVTVVFSHNNGLAFMAGAGYSLAAFQVAARFDGETDHIEGDYVLVMFENQTWPIIGGREDLGVPKLFADISPIKHLRDGQIRCDASIWGHLLFSLEVPRMSLQTLPVRAIAARRMNSRPWLGYKYIPSIEGPADADYPTISKNDTKLEKLWLAKTANIRFGKPSKDDVGQINVLINALGKLRVMKPIQAVHFKGSSVLRYDLSRRLR
jgi:acetoacetate decarboxylase